MRRIAPLLALLAAAGPAAACTFCAGSLAGRQTLREHHQTAKVVVQGKLKNPKFDASGFGGTTELHVAAVLKGGPAVAPGAVLVLPRYYPVVGDTPSDFLVFGTLAGGQLDPTFGTPAAPAVAEYLAAAAKLPADAPARRLGFFFAHLDAADATVSADAFAEFAKAPDADILRAKAALAPAKLRTLLADPNTPAERLGVYGMMLGLCGTAADAKPLAALVAGPPPLPERVAGNLGGLLAGLVLLDPPAGWLALEAALADGKRPPNERLAAIGAVRFFQGSRPDARPAVLRCYRALVREGEFADLAADDLRRFGWWDLTADVLSRYDTGPPVVRRSVVRYALACPSDDAKRFLAAARAREPKLVADVEETARLFEK